MGHPVRRINRRCPTSDEWGTLFEKRFPDLIMQLWSGIHDPTVVDGVFVGLTDLRKKKKKINKFEHLCNFDVCVPSDYKHHTSLSTFRERHGSQLYFLNSDFDDPNYMLATTQLIPGLRFCVKVFGIVPEKNVGSDECIEKIRSEGGVLVGAQGIALAYKQGAQSLPVRSLCVSFDEENALWHTPGYAALPILYIHQRTEDKLEAMIDLASFETMWYGTSCILVFVPTN